MYEFIKMPIECTDWMKILWDKCQYGKHIAEKGSAGICAGADAKINLDVEINAHAEIHVSVGIHAGVGAGVGIVADFDITSAINFLSHICMYIFVIYKFLMLTTT